jgi:hypothetical protein
METRGGGRPRVRSAQPLDLLTQLGAFVGFLAVLLLLSPNVGLQCGLLGFEGLDLVSKPVFRYFGRFARFGEGE